MANEIQYESGVTGQTIYAVGRNEAGQAWNGSAFVSYTTTRSTFAQALAEVGVTGYYGPLGIAGASWWQIYLQVGGSPSHSNDIRLASGEAVPLTDDITSACHDAVTVPTPTAIAAAVASNPYIAPALVTIADNLDAPISSISGGGAATNVNQYPVPTARTWTLKQTADGLAGELPIIRHAGEVNQVFAIDWRNDLATNGRLLSVDDVTIISGTEGGIAISSADADTGVDRSQSKHTITLTTPGTYVIQVSATYDHGEGIGTVTLIVR